MKMPLLQSSSVPGQDVTMVMSKKMKCKVAHELESLLLFFPLLQNKIKHDGGKERTLQNCCRVLAVSISKTCPSVHFHFFLNEQFLKSDCFRKLSFLKKGSKIKKTTWSKSIKRN